MTKTSEAVFSGCFIAVFSIVLLALMVIPLSLLNGFVLMTLWAWFVTPLFGLLPLSLIEAIGLGIIVSYLTHQYGATQEKFETAKEALAGIFKMILHPIITLAFAWVIQLFI